METATPALWVAASDDSGYNLPGNCFKATIWRDQLATSAEVCTVPLSFSCSLVVLIEVQNCCLVNYPTKYPKIWAFCCPEKFKVGSQFFFNLSYMLSYMILWITRAQFDTGRSLWLDLWPWSPSTLSSPSFNVDAVFPRLTFKIIRYRDRDRDLDEMNSSALESRDHGLEITTLDVVYEDYHHDTSSSSSSSSLFQAARPVSQYIHKDTEHREIL